jgi:hypothetical protein
MSSFRRNSGDLDATAAGHPYGTRFLTALVELRGAFGVRLAAIAVMYNEPLSKGACPLRSLTIPIGRWDPPRTSSVKDSARCRRDRRSPERPPVPVMILEPLAPLTLT